MRVGILRDGTGAQSSRTLRATNLIPLLRVQVGLDRALEAEQTDTRAVLASFRDACVGELGNQLGLGADGAFFLSRLGKEAAVRSAASKGNRKPYQVHPPGGGKESVPLDD